MRKSLVLATLLVLVCSAAALAGVPDPTRSGTSVSGNVLPCQYRFRADAGIDELSLFVTLRDAFDVPVADCSLSVALANASSAIGNCCPESQALNVLTGNGRTNGSGVALFTMDTVAGKGTVDLDVTAHCTGDIAISSDTITFTSTDLNASLDVLPSFSTDVLDIGVWAGCYQPSPYCQTSDFTCDNTVDVLDIGIVAGGLAAGCGSAPCP